jgi:LuxR family maltose regulon positive regulatory protein
MAVLLKTKLVVPPVRDVQVARSHLFERLNHGMAGKLTLVSAPAGYGKTSLLSAWVKTNCIPAAWLSLDQADNDPLRFWLYTITALQVIEPSIGNNALTILHSATVRTIEILITELLNEIADLQDRFVLIFDDYHLIENTQIQDGVLFFLNQMPLTMHLVISTRADPPWPLARFRGRGEITEIRIEDLRFTYAETTEFLDRCMQLSLVSEEISSLETRTEGWIAGLQMSALSMHDLADKSRFIRALSGSHRYIMDYLVEEVLNRQPPDIQEFLLKTSILDRLTASLCDAVIGTSKSDIVLRRLEEANIFLLPLDDERRWYRYHPLFAELLRSILVRNFPDQVNVLHQRASEWYVAQGLLSEAVNQASLSGDVEFVTRLIEKNALTMLSIYNEQLPVLTAWLDQLPQEVFQKRPVLAVAQAWVLAYAGQLGAADAVIQATEKIIEEIPTETNEERLIQQNLTGYLTAIRGYLVTMTGDLASGKILIEKALTLLPTEDIFAKIFGEVVLSVTVGLQGDLDEGITILTNAANLCQGVNYSLLQVMILSELAGLLILKGNLSQVIISCQQAIQLANEYARLMGLYPPNVGFAYARLSFALREKNDLASAIRNAREAVRIASRWGQKDCLSISYMYLANVLQADDQLDEARIVMQKARETAISFSSSEEIISSAFEAKFYALQGDDAFLIRWAGACGLSSPDELQFRRVQVHIVYARALIAQGKIAESLGLLSRLLQVTDSAQAIFLSLQIMILQALAFQINDEPDKALFSLKNALDMAEPEGYVRIFIDEGKRMEGLLRLALRRGINYNFVQSLLSAMKVSAIPQGDGKISTEILPMTPTGVSLTTREVAILELLMTGLSIVDIANSLFITMSTLRTHIRNIYVKLEVHSRMEAASVGKKILESKHNRDSTLKPDAIMD